MHAAPDVDSLAAMRLDRVRMATIGSVRGSYSDFK